MKGKPDCVCTGKRFRDDGWMDNLGVVRDTAHRDLVRLVNRISWSVRSGRGRYVPGWFRMMKSSDNHPITFSNHPISQSAREGEIIRHSSGHRTIIRCYVEPACTQKKLIDWSCITVITQKAHDELACRYKQALLLNISRIASPKGASRKFKSSWIVVSGQQSLNIAINDNPLQPVQTASNTIEIDYMTDAEGI